MNSLKFVTLFVLLTVHADGADIPVADYVNLIIPYFQFRNLHVLTHLGCFSARKTFIILQRHSLSTFFLFVSHIPSDGTVYIARVSSVQCTNTIHE